MQKGKHNQESQKATPAPQEVMDTPQKEGATPPKKNNILLPLLVSGTLAVAFVALLFVNRDTIATAAKALFDPRPDLTQEIIFETITTEQVEEVTVWVQSAEYPDYTETKTITDAAEIAQLVESIVAAKLVIDEDAQETEDEEPEAEDETPEEALAQALQQSTPEDTTGLDCYYITLEEQTIAFYTKENDATFIYINGDWQEIEPVDQPDFYEWYQSSAEAATIYDINGLVFYPQEWVAGETELAAESYGIDVSYHQGVIDWEQVANDGVDFAMIRVGVRYAVSGTLEEDVLARYNLQEATKYGIAVGVYFFSTATTEAEVLEEAALVLDVISGYAITYPVVYDCEMFHTEGNRNNTLAAAERSNLAEVFLDAIEAEGYTGMFYASKNDLTLNAQWETNYLQSKYRIWVAQYPGDENEAMPYGVSTYEGRHEMWQYTAAGTVAGIEGGVDRNVAYFSYSELATPKGTPAEEVAVDYDALAKMEDTGDLVTAKEYVNVRSSMDSTDDSNIMGQLTSSDVVTRISVGGNGWSKIEFNGGEGYVITSLITTEVSIATEEPAEADDDFETEFETVNEVVTAKEVTNLRNMPSVTEEASEVIAVLYNGDTATRTGVSDEGFSRVEYQGQVLYCVSSYLEVVG